MGLRRIFLLYVGFCLCGCPTELEDPKPPTKPNSQDTTDAAVIEIHAPDASLPHVSTDAGRLFYDAGTQVPDGSNALVATDAGVGIFDSGSHVLPTQNDAGILLEEYDASFFYDSGVPFIDNMNDSGNGVFDGGNHAPPEQSDSGNLDAGPPPVFDCLGIENGSAVFDCNNTCAGDAFIDNCNQCVGGTTGLLNCEQDCNDNWGGIAVWDSCGNCIDMGDMPCETSVADAGVDAGTLLEERDASIFYDSGTLFDDNATDAAVTNTEDAGNEWYTWDTGISFYDGGWSELEADAGNEEDAWDGGLIGTDAGPELPILDAGTTPVDQAACREAYFHDNLANLFRRTCALCHTIDGIAYEQGASLVFASPYSGQESEIDALNYQGIISFLNADENNASLLWQKPTTALYHGGGEQVLESSNAEFALLDFVAMHEEEMACEAANVPPLTESDLILTDHAAALRFAALLLSDTLPTPEELDAITTNIDSLDPALDRIMDTPTFAERIAIIYEDVLLTNTYRSKNNSLVLQKAWGQQLDSHGNTRGRYQWYKDYVTFPPLNERDVYNEMAGRTAYGFSRSAKELIKYVITERKDFGEILTANYTMMNIYSAPIFEREDAFDAGYFDDESYWEERDAGFPDLDGGVLPDAPMPSADLYRFKPVVIPAPITTAGLLTDINFLATWPTNEVNLNRSRSREILKTFLNTDILAMVNRTPESFGGTDINPTYNNPTCVSCHHIMDPLAGAFQNYPKHQFQALYDPLKESAQPRWADTDPQTQLLPPGLSKSHPVPSNRMDDSLAWLAEQLIDDPRFAAATVRVIYQGLSGRPAMTAPNIEDEDFLPQQRVYQLQRFYLEELETVFVQSGRDLNAMIKAMVKSPLIRVSNFNNSNLHLHKHLGLHRMLTPEDLERKLFATTDRKWSSYYGRVDGDPNYHWRFDTDEPHRSHLVEFRESCGNGGNGCYARWYGLLGGQNITPSGGNSRRLSSENAVLNGALQRMSSEMPWRVVPRDFAIISETDGVFERLFFPYVDLDTLPTDESGNNDNDAQNAIKANLTYLAQRLWGQNLNHDHPEIMAAYNLFVDAVALQTPYLGIGAGFSGSVEQDEIDYKETWEAAHGLTSPIRREITHDTYGTLRAWRIVLDYFISDYHFLHQSLQLPGGPQ